MIIPVKKTLNNAGHIDAKLIVFSEICQKNPAKSAVFYWLFLGEVSPWNRPIFLWICPWKSFEIWLFPLKCREIGRFSCEFWLFSREIGGFFREFWLFPAKIRRNRPIFPQVLTFSRENPAKFCVFFREISEALFRENNLKRSQGSSIYKMWRLAWRYQGCHWQWCTAETELLWPAWPALSLEGTASY